ncbi:MAG TPA: thioesterase domain-containing protein [Syntrophomonadaceae bacterium]|nr:thioesterase domain-containing protein [Syntrophomonadaceae bacterium]HNX29318.1 thioesterase domain-containing protein [Syntrophomonadaceae bacterium]HPR93014.1 thioesterase domain-containing protein [Syntrophomonadaceae bacterium]
MPTNLYILDQIPASDAGKVQRKMLYDKITAMGIPAQPLADTNETIILPRNETENKLYKIFRKLLPVKGISVNDTFFELGGDSLKAAVLFEEIKKIFKLQIPLKYIFKTGTIEYLADYINNNQTNKPSYPFLVAFNEEGSKKPIFFVHAAEGKAVIIRYIANDFDSERPFYSFDLNPEENDWVYPITFEQIAEQYIKDIKAVQPEGPYILAGQCVGGTIAYEMACQLTEQNQEISLLAMYDPVLPGTEEVFIVENRFKGYLKEIKRIGIKNFLSRKTKSYRMRIINYFFKKSPENIKQLVSDYELNRAIIAKARSLYRVNKKYDGKVIYFKPLNNFSNTATNNSIIKWSEFASDIHVVPLEGNHISVFHIENAENTRKVLENVLRDYQ